MEKEEIIEDILEKKDDRDEKKKKRKATLLESIHSNNRKAEKITERKNEIEKEEERIRQVQTINVKNIYDYVFKSLEIDMEKIIFNSKNEKEIVEKVKEKLGIGIQDD